MDPQIAYQPPTGPDQVVERDWLYERPDGTTVPAPDEAIGNECGKVTALWDLFLVPVPEVPRGRRQDEEAKDDLASWLDEPTAGFPGMNVKAKADYETGSHDCESDNYDF